MLGSDYWKQRASEYRRLAADADNDTDRDAYRRLAESCDELAERQDQLKNHKPPARKTSKS